MDHGSKDRRASQGAMHPHASKLGPKTGTSMAEELSDLAWALLRMLDRNAQGGPQPPCGDPFTAAYHELEAHGLAAGGHLTERGKTTLHKQYRTSPGETT